MLKVLVLAGLVALAGCVGQPVTPDPVIEQARAEAHRCERIYPAAVGTYFARASCVSGALSKLPGSGSMRSQVILSATLLAAAKEDRGMITEDQGDAEVQAKIAKLDAVEAPAASTAGSDALMMIGTGLQNYGAARSAPMPRAQTTTCVRVGTTIQCYTN